MQEYIIDKTLFNHQLISLKKFTINSIPEELKANRNITVKIEDCGTYRNCHIDTTVDRRLRLPLEAILWVKNNFPFSVAFCSIDTNKVIWKKSEVKEFYARKKSFNNINTNNNPRLEKPAETLKLSWIQKGDSCPYLLIQKGFQITTKNAQEVLSAEAIATVLPYIFSSVQNTSLSSSIDSHNNKKSYILHKTTPWLSVKQYTETSFSHPGLYLLRRKDENNDYCYYIGKSVDIKNRIIKSKDVLCHPEEKNESNKAYTEIACLSLNFDEIIQLYQDESDFVPTNKQNPAVAKGSKIDASLYSIEDVAIHVVSMILRGEGKELDNKQYRMYTSEALSKSKLDK